MEKVVGLFFRGGVIMWPLLLCSILSVTVSIERYFFWLKRDRLRRAGAPGLEQARLLVRGGDRAAAAALLARVEDPAGAMLAVALDGGEAAAAMTASAAVPMRACRRGLRLLDTIVTVAPMLGLLGTVVGVIQAFGFAGSAGAFGHLDARIVGGGIAEALITTAFGLSIAIVTVVPYNFFSARVQREAEELSALATSMEEALAHEDRVGA